MKHETGAKAHTSGPPKQGDHRPYMGLLLSTAISFGVMYLVMYAMANRWTNVYFNLSNVYMTGLMAGSMVPIMLFTMRDMFMDRKVTLAWWVGSVLALALFWILLRTEAGVGDRQLMRAMIPHHAAAIQMCQESSLKDARVTALCQEIVASQEREIADMRALLGNSGIR